MDALTNVVAVLILVLVLVQADVSRKVQKFLDDLQPATPEEVADSRKSIDELGRKLLVAQARLREKPATPEDIAEEKRQIALLEKSMEENRELLADLSQVRELERKTRAERNAESGKTVAIQKEIARLEGLLDTTPPVDPDTPTVVNIPNSRPIPEGASTYYALAIKDRIHVVDPVTPLKIFEREFEKNKRDWLIHRINVKGKPDRYIYDGRKIAAHFKGFNWGNSRGQKIEVITQPTRTWLQLVITPDLAKGGTPLEDLSKPGNPFAQAVKVISGSFKAVLLFRVNPDSFNAYLEGRELADKANLASGWEMSWSRNVAVGIPDITVKRLEEPPKPTKPSGPKPPPLKPKLD